jgi:hypothetical protein
MRIAKLPIAKLPVVKLLVAAAAALLVGACNTTSLAERRAADDARCRSYGFRAGTEAFAKCLLQVDLDRAAERRAVRYDYAYGFGPRGSHWGRGWW